MLREARKRNSLGDMVDLHMIPVSQGHTYALWVWANDIATRRASARGFIPWTEHVAWLQSLNGNVDHQIATDRDTGQPLGVIRINFFEGMTEGEISYVVAPEARGQRIGTQLIQWAMDTHANQTRLTAQVDHNNDYSNRIFSALGWQAVRCADRMRYVWPPETPGA